MERASMGADVLIYRHGRPLARLGPPGLNARPDAAD